MINMVVVPINGITDVHMKRNVLLMHRNPGVMAVNNVFWGVGNWDTLYIC